MVKRKKSRESKIRVGIKCQCQDRAVKRPGPLIRQTTCKKCGKRFKTNKKEDYCFNCQR